MTEPTDLEVEARAKEMHDEMWPGATWCPGLNPEKELMKAARTVLRREARLVAALEKDAMAFDIAKQPLNAARVREVLAAHRAATRPEPTLAEAVQAYIDRSTDDSAFQAMRAALAREQERGGGR